LVEVVKATRGRFFAGGVGVVVACGTVGRTFTFNPSVRLQGSGRVHISEALNN
jgi:hypothetical protein